MKCKLNECQPSVWVPEFGNKLYSSVLALYEDTPEPFHRLEFAIGDEDFLLAGARDIRAELRGEKIVFASLIAGKICYWVILEAEPREINIDGNKQKFYFLTNLGEELI